MDQGARTRGLAGGCALIACLLAAPASAEPLDLGNGAPRAVRVRFEISPPDLPGQTGVRFGEPLRGRVEPGEHPGELRVRVAAEDVERVLLRHERPLPGSFSDFVWTFESATGHVRSATLTGVLLRRVALGFVRFDADTEVRVRMDTRGPAGFTPGHVLGEKYHRLCRGAQAAPCQMVEPRTYDPGTGYVNAVGEVAAHHSGLTVTSFSPLGEAVFSEIERALPEIPRGGGQQLGAAQPADTHLRSGMP